MSKENSTKGRKPLTPQEKKQRQEQLLNESIETRTKRVLNPRIKRILKNMDMLISALKSKRYSLTTEKQEKVLSEIADRYAEIENVFKGASKKEIEDIL